MRRMMLVVGIGAGLVAMATLLNTDSMAVEPVIKKNFNLPKQLVPPPAPGEPPALSRVLDVSATEQNDKPTEYSDYSSYGPKILPAPGDFVIKKNFNLPKTLPEIEIQTTPLKYPLFDNPETGARSGGDF